MSHVAGEPKHIMGWPAGDWPSWLVSVQGAPNDRTPTTGALCTYLGDGEPGIHAKVCPSGARAKTKLRASGQAAPTLLCFKPGKSRGLRTATAGAAASDGAPPLPERDQG